jgi:hypothetical protein
MARKRAISRDVTVRAAAIRSVLERMYELLKKANVPHDWFEGTT